MSSFLRFFLILLPVCVLSCKPQTKPEQGRPNVLFILVDDLGAHDLGFSGSSYYETPNIDRLAQGGMVFTQGYAASRVCSPSRASIMTGQFTARHGITDWIGARSEEDWRKMGRHDKLLPAAYVHELPKSDMSMAEAFKAAGYTTFFAGKWHLGDKGSYPEDHGFDINKGGWERGSPVGGYFAPWENPSLPANVPGENLSMRLAQETSQFIKGNRDQPFFAFLSFYAVHGPIQTTSEKWKYYRDKAVAGGVPQQGYSMERRLPIRQQQDNPIYAGLVSAMDDAVGEVLQTLEAAGVANNTIVVFTSDNGGVASGDAFSTTNLPLRGGKGYQWEGGIREPYVIKVPWLNTGGRTSDYPVVGTDFYPTLLDLAGADLYPDQHKDGISLKPILEGDQVDLKRPLYWHYPHYGNQGGDPSSIIQENGWKLIYYWEDGDSELYQISADIAEGNDLSMKEPEKAEAMKRKLLDWLEGVGARYPTLDSLYNEEKALARHKKMVEEKMPQLEAQRMEFLKEDFEPNPNWWDSKLTKD